MPKKLDYDNPVRLIREALGLTQPEFAETLGVSESHLQKVELGKNRVSEEFGAVLALRYGVAPSSLKAKGKPKFILSTPKTSGNTIAENIRAWADLPDLFEEWSMHTLEEFLFPKIRVLLETAMESGRGLNVLDAVDRAVMKIARNFRLEPAIKRRVSENLAGKGAKSWDPYLQYAADQLRFQAAGDIQVVYKLTPKAEKTKKGGIPKRRQQVDVGTPPGE